jgi:3-dehydroquinate synthase
MPITNITEELQIQSGQGAYPARFHESVAAVVAQLAGSAKAAVIVDANVDALYASSLAPLKSAFPYRTVPALETEKTLAGVERTLQFLQDHKANKETRLIAIGGGIIQDIATFSSHLYYRCIPFVFVPTTLLSMADSCIGAKCGINFGQFKNQLGVFQSPESVEICEAFLGTLSDTDIASGYGEIVKLALTGSAELYSRVERAVTLGGFRNPELTDLIAASLAVKKEVIEADEYERDLRRILNYGHTFGHALEAITGHAVPHGIAVAWGMDLANFISCRRGKLARAEFERMHRFLARYFAMPMDRPVTAAALIEASRRDKKNVRGKLTMALLERPGRLVIDYVDYDSALEASVTEFLELNHAFFGN